MRGTCQGPQLHPERSEHDFEDVARTVDRRRLLVNRNTDFDTNRPVVKLQKSNGDFEQYKGAVSLLK